MLVDIASDMMNIIKINRWAEQKSVDLTNNEVMFYDQIKEKVESRYVNGVARIGAAPIIDMEAVKAGNKKKKSFGGAKNANMVTRKNKGVKNAKRMEAK